MDENVKEFAEELCKLLKKHKMGRFSGSFSSGFAHNPSYQTYQFNWTSGRHEAETGVIHVHYEERHTVKISENH